MPFYFRIPLPGPFGYSKRIGGKRRKDPRQPARRLTRAERQEQREQANRAIRTFFAWPSEITDHKDGSLSFLANVGTGESHRPVQVTIGPGEGEGVGKGENVRRAVQENGTLAVTFRPDMPTVESVEGLT